VAERYASELVLAGENVVQLVKRQQRGAAGRDGGLHVSHGGSVRAVFVAAMDESHRLGAIAELLRPVERRIAPTDDDDALSAEFFRIGHSIENSAAVP